LPKPRPGALNSGPIEPVPIAQKSGMGTRAGFLPTRSGSLGKGDKLILEYGGKKPQLHPSVFLAPTGVVIGDVVLGESSSVWFGAVLRGDINQVRIGQRVNLQDMVMVHVDEGPFHTVVGNDVTVGHRAILHGCRIEDTCLIGMGSTILSGAQIGEGSIVAAGAVVMENSVIPPRSLVAGIPGKILRPMSDKEIEGLKDHALNYAALAASYLKQGLGERI
jgi:carbonic anhydrase/acetyltransferase-like protein (isoleucine patch superfamily)